MMSPTSQFNTEQIFSNTSMMTFSSLDNFDIVVVLKPVCKRKYQYSIRHRRGVSLSHNRENRNTAIPNPLDSSLTTCNTVQDD